MTTTINDLSDSGYEVGVARESDDDPTFPTVYTINGKGFSGLQVRITPSTGRGFTEGDQELLDSLADPVPRVDREFQVDEPAAQAAREELEGMGYAVERPDPVVDLFTLTIKWGDEEGTVVASGKGPGDLAALAASLPDLRIPFGPLPPVPGG